MLSRGAVLWINRVVWTLLVGAVVLVGTIVSLGRYYLPSVAAHQQQLVAAFNRRTGLQLSVGNLSASWQHLSPHFVIDNLRLRNPLNPQQTVLQIAHAELQLGLFRSIANGTIAISRLRGSGVQVQLEEATLGHWQLAGFGGPSTMPLDRVIDFLAAIYRAELSDSTVDLKFFGGGEAHLAGQTLRLQRAGNFRRINLELRFGSDLNAGEKGAPLRIVVESSGDPRALNTFSGRGYIEFRGVDLTPVLPAAKAFGMDFEHGRIDGAAWLSWHAGGAIEVHGKAQMPQFDLGGVSKLALAPVKNIKAEFLIRDHAGRRELWLPELTGVWHGVALKFPQLNVSVDSAQPQHALVALPELQLAPLAEAMLADTNLPAHLRDILTALAPRGELRSVQLDLPLRPDQLGALRLRAEFEKISAQAWEGAPGIAAASGYIDTGLHAGLVDLVSDGFGMTFPHVYRKPVHFDKVRGQIGWHLENETVLVDSGPIAVQSDAGRATAQFALDLPLQHGATPLMTLQVGLQDSAAQYRDSFIPYTLQPALLQWLQRAIGKGDIPLGGFIYRGSLRAHDHLNNTVQLFLQVRDAQLAYRPEWPPLRDIRAAVWVDDGGVRVDVPQARLYDHIVLANGAVALQHEGDVSWLTLQTNAAADDDDILRLLRETPLRQHIGTALDLWHWRGPTQSHVELGIAVAGSRPLEVKVDSQLTAGMLTMADQNITLANVQGTISYRADSGLRADALSAQWFGKPVTIKVSTQPDGAMLIGAQGRIAMADLQQWLRQPLFEYASGDTPFAATLRIANGTGALHVQSDLTGASIDLPLPYRKPAEQTLPLAIDMDLGAPHKLAATLGDWADLRLQWGGATADETALSATVQSHAMPRLDGGILRLGRKGKAAFGAGQFVITGAVSAVDLSAWGEALRARADNGTGADSNDGNQARDAPAVYLRELHFGSAQLAGQTLRELIVSGRRDSASWTLQARADKVAGTLTVPDAKTQPWRAQLNYLRLPVPASSQSTAAANAALLEQFDPRRALALDLHIDHLWRGDEDFGWLETQLRPIAEGLRFENIKGKLRAVGIDAGDTKPASLTWTRRDGVDRTAFNGKLAVADIGDALQRWHYEAVLTSKKGFADIDVQWPGRPDQFQFAHCDGRARLQIDDGRFLRASGSTTGALKVVGIFNFANFLRRLQLNFSDVFKDGVSFDHMSGALSTQQGVLETDEPVEIKSPSSRFRVAGQIDFNTDQTDMELVATLPVASNLPWVAALTGGLPVAAGVYVASKVFENQFDKFSSAAYQISGPWTDPQVKLSRVFDDKLPKRNEVPQKAPAAAPEATP